VMGTPRRPQSLRSGEQWRNLEPADSRSYIRQAKVTSSDEAIRGSNLQAD
jgi:hypothetical protein